MTSKFKGQRADNKEWIEGFYAEGFGGYYIMPNCYFGTREFDEDEDGNPIISRDIALGGFIEVIPETVQLINLLNEKK